MKRLSDEVLIETYLKALDLKLEEAFIRLLYAEIVRRNLDVPKKLPMPV